MNYYRYSGFLNIYKEAGWTSMDVCAKLKGILGVRRIGHAGTLDPMAEGVLPVAVGRATKDIDMVGGGIKEYRAGMLLGVASETEDITGLPVSSYGSKADPELYSGLSGEELAASLCRLAESGAERLPSEEQVRAAILSFIGEYDQLTPKYSARKVNGKKLYEYARAGIEVERKRKHIMIYDIVIDEIRLPHVIFTVRCSQGTYVRTICNDIGEKLGCGALMESLLRTKVGRFSAENALRLSQVQQLRDSESIDSVISIAAPTAVSIGKFDGTHLGHQALFRELRKVAEKKHLRTCVLILKFGSTSVLMDADRKRRMAELGIDYCIEVAFTEEMKNMTAGDFLKKILVDKFNMKAIVAGNDVSFGKGREGNAEFLNLHAEEFGYEVDLIEKVCIDLAETREDPGTEEKIPGISGEAADQKMQNKPVMQAKQDIQETMEMNRGDQDGTKSVPAKGEVISSTLLRRELTKGDMLHVTRLLGTHYAISGKVIHGRHIGTDKLSVPTLNIAVPKELILPPNGVYAVKAEIFDERSGRLLDSCTGIANLGLNPTVSSDEKGDSSAQELRLETHAFDEIGDCYGKTARIQLCYFIRHERKFASIEELKKQVSETDIPTAKAYFLNNKKGT